MKKFKKTVHEKFDPKIIVHNNDVTKALRILKKKVKDANLFFDLKKKSYYKKKSEIKREKKNLAKLRNKYNQEKIKKDY